MICEMHLPSVHKNKIENVQQLHTDCRQIMQQPFPLWTGLWLVTVTSLSHFTRSRTEQGRKVKQSLGKRGVLTKAFGEMFYFVICLVRWGHPLLL